jgi:hypothetical protein
VKAWSPSEQLGWLTVEVYLEKIQPHLAGITVAAISSALDISLPALRRRNPAQVDMRRIHATGRRLHGSSSTQRKSEIAKQKGYGSGKSTICLSPARDAKRLLCLVRLLKQKGTHTISPFFSQVDYFRFPPHR